MPPPLQVGEDVTIQKAVVNEQMKILYELSWLWETLGIALATTAVCLTCAVLISRAQKRVLSKRAATVIGAAAFVLAVLAVILLARTPALI